MPEPFQVKEPCSSGLSQPVPVQGIQPPSADNLAPCASRPPFAFWLAWCSLVISGSGAASVAAPTDRSTISFPSWFGSRGRLGRRVAMVPVWGFARERQVRHDFKLRHYPPASALDAQRQLLQRATIRERRRSVTPSRRDVEAAQDLLRSCGSI